ncbi:MAG: single-stranded DNA-binding protein [Patescibacteria group bacterium]
MNKVFLIGNLTKEPEVRVTGTGKKVVNFSIAVNEGKDMNGQEIVQYFNMSAWERLADIIEQYVKKGTKVAVVGRLQNRSWDKPDGTKGYATDVSVRELEILTSKADSERLAAAAQATSSNSSNQQATPTSQADDKTANETKAALEVPEIDVDSINVQMPF